MSKRIYGGVRDNILVLCIVYLGVVLSDMITFGIGVLLKQGFFQGLKKSLLRLVSSCSRNSRPHYF